MARIFIGIRVPEDIARRIIRLQMELPSSLRMIPDPNLHVTLLPPWEETDIATVKQKLQSVHTRIRPFVLSFAKVLPGPNAKNPRLLWTQSMHPPKSIFILKKKLEKALGQKPEKRVFFPHITVARFDKNTHEDYRDIAKDISWEFEVDSFVLYQSHLTPKGAEYEVLGEYQIL